MADSDVGMQFGADAVVDARGEHAMLSMKFTYVVRGLLHWTENILLKCLAALQDWPTQKLWLSGVVDSFNKRN